MDNEDRTVEYKGKSYKLLFIGNTKFGRRAHLAFRNGSSNFWVNADLIAEKEQSDGTEADPNRNACTDAALANVIIAAGVHQLARDRGGDLEQMKKINACAAWLRGKVSA